VASPTSVAAIRRCRSHNQLKFLALTTALRPAARQIPQKMFWACNGTALPVEQFRMCVRHQGLGKRQRRLPRGAPPRR